MKITGIYKVTDIDKNKITFDDLMDDEVYIEIFIDEEDESFYQVGKLYASVEGDEIDGGYIVDLEKAVLYSI